MILINGVSNTGNFVQHKNWKIEDFSMKPTTWNKLEKSFDDFSNLKSEPASAEQIKVVEDSLGVESNADYKEFILKYGGAIVGAFPIYGLHRVEPMDVNLWSVLGVTNRYRKEGWPNMSDRYVISSDHSDNPFVISNDGEIIVYNHDYDETVIVSETFEEFLISCLKDCE